MTDSRSEPGLVGTGTNVRSETDLGNGLPNGSREIRHKPLSLEGLNLLI
ncbi:hypothetical protein J2Z65_001367 [Paenibacillus aceris]|uniref:Uncharacterized protein n=1 Tax=Paenibacillus aceris TaxID=869555 RepID=A0ABS4HW41_9BACL|nr:hypothetical protein [Paenibacillus aceris]